MSTKAISVAALPDDSLAAVLGVLPPRTLAVARCVCKAWRDIIDGRALLRPHFLPHSVRGIFINYIDHLCPYLFARPSSSSTFPKIDGVPSFTHHVLRVLDHCNGLVLSDVLQMRTFLACNPATQRWTLLPSPGTTDRSYFDHRWSCSVYIAFDPMVSPHYEVFMIPDVPKKPKEDDEPFGMEQLPEDQMVDEDPFSLMQWPPSPWILKAFSSRTGLWEDRLFVREDQPAGTVEDMRQDPLGRLLWGGNHQHYAVYLNRELYVHCRGSFVARFSLSTDKYQVIKLPTMGTDDVEPCLGRCNNAVYFGIIIEGRQLLLWKLIESNGNMEWLLKYEADIGLYADHIASLPYNNKARQPDGSWMVQEDYVSESDSDSDADKQSEESIEWCLDKDDIFKAETESEESIEWNSDKDDFFTAEVRDELYLGNGHFRKILGFHPYKEVVFLEESFVVASYHFTSPAKVQYLGNSQPRCYYNGHASGMYESFIYTPCMIGDLLHEGDLGDI